MKFVKPDRIWLKEHPELNEKWIQDRIAQDPAILGLGDLILKDRERMQLGFGDQVALVFTTVLNELTRALEEEDEEPEEAGLDLMPYKAGKYRVRLTTRDLSQHQNEITALLKTAFESRGM